MSWFLDLSPTMQAFLATMFTWGLTAAGAGLVFFFTTIKKTTMDGMLGFAAGVMIAASFWSLLDPAIAMAESMGMVKWIPPVVGFLAGGAFLWLVDRSIPHIHPGMKETEGPESTIRRSFLLVFAVTLHNIPEGLAVGVAFGATAAGLESASLAGALALALGIGIQNFPEGAAVSLPLRREGLSKRKAFMYGQASGIVEPISGVIGALAVIMMQPILPYALSFAAGAMIYVVVEELIPEAQSAGDSDIATIGAMLGFAVMMLLDVALG